MNASLLIAIRKSKERLVPALEKQRTLRPLRTVLLSQIRIFSPLMEVPIFVSAQRIYFLDAHPIPNSKAYAVIDELTKAGTPSGSIYTRQRGSYFHYLTRLIRLLFRLPVAVAFIAGYHKRFQSLDALTWQVVIGYMIYKRFFKRNQHLIPIIISDISPILHMQWSAAVSLNREVFWWQDDYHHYKGFSAENYMPYPATIAALLNQHGLETVLDKNPKAKTYRRNYTPVNLLKPLPQTPKVGIATNASFEANPEQLQYIDSIRRRLGVNKLYFRLHPNTRLTSKELAASWMEIAPNDEVLGDFCEKIDLVMVGNSAVQLKLICLGVAVIHIQGLDPFGFDLYGYCKEGFCYGAADVDGISVERVSEFYRNPVIGERLNQFVNLQTDIKDLSEIEI